MSTSAGSAWCGPCCSVEPTGSITVWVAFRTCATSRLVISPRKTVGGFMALPPGIEDSTAVNGDGQRQGGRERTARGDVQVLDLHLRRGPRAGRRVAGNRQANGGRGFRRERDRIGREPSGAAEAEAERDRGGVVQAHQHALAGRRPHLRRRRGDRTLPESAEVLVQSPDVVAEPGRGPAR